MKCINCIKSRNYAVGGRNDAVGVFFIIVVNLLVSVCHLYRVSHLVYPFVLHFCASELPS